jgi:acetyl esterase/lipase
MKFPLLLFAHGGAWRFGSKDWHAYLGATLTSQGIGAAVINYRLSPAVKHPEHVRDVARAFAWVRKQAGELGADPGRLYVSGHSAGAHLVALLALDPRYLKAEGLAPSHIRGVVGISGPYALVGRLFSEVFGEDEAARQAAFPLNHVRDQPAAQIPPFLILYAERDYRGLPLSASTLGEALRRHGAKAEVVEIKDRDHLSIITGFAKAEDAAVKATVQFIQAE